MNFFNILQRSNHSKINDLNDSSIYEIARLTLAPKTFAEQNSTIYTIAKFFTSTYHFISFSTAFLAVYFYSKELDLLTKIAFFIISTILLISIEVVKGSTSNSVFHSAVRKDTINKLSIFVLFITTIFSFATSVYSTKLSVYQITTNSKFASIDSTQNTQIDSINAIFDTQIKSLQSSIVSSQKTIETKKGWQNNLAQTNLQNAQNQLNFVLENKEKATSKIEEKAKNKLSDTSEKGLEKAYLIAFIVFLFESFNICAYYYIFYYLKNVLLESALIENQNDPVTTTSLNDPVTTTSLNDPVTTTSLKVSTIPSFENPYLNTTTTEKKQIGFQFQRQTTGNEQNKDFINCKNCNKRVEKKAYNHLFCSTKCRMKNWEQEKGLKLNFSSKSKTP
jgi:hypothetical protein